MKGIIEITVRFIRAVRKVYARKGIFLVLFVVSFLASVAMLARLDLLPEAQPPLVEPAISENTRIDDQSIVSASVKTVPELPMMIEIPSVGTSATISNPSTTDVAALDSYLLKGAVRYPTSAKLGETGNVVLFGHSSYIPVVRNQAYKSFNGIQKLVKGDVVTVYSSATAYTYRVKSVTKESTNNAAIPLSIDDKLLTLSTCDSFGAQSDRFVVVAEFVESHLISK